MFGLFNKYRSVEIPKATFDSPRPPVVQITKSSTSFKEELKQQEMVLKKSSTCPECNHVNPPLPPRDAFLRYEHDGHAIEPINKTLINKCQKCGCEWYVSY